MPHSKGRATHALDTEETLRLVVESVKDYAIFGLDPEGRVLTWNPGAERIYGYPADEIIGQHFARFYTEEDVRRGHPQHELAVAAREGRYEEEGWRIRRDGEQFWASVVITALPAPGGGVGGFGKVTRDLTERQQSERALRQQARLAALYADINAAFARSDDLRAVLRRVCEAAVQHLDAAFARVWTLNETEQTLELQASAGLYTHTDGPHSRVPVGHLKIGRIAEERAPHFTNDVLHDPRISDPDWARREGMVSFAGYPLLLGDRLIGVMAMFARHPLSGSVLRELGAVADAVAQFIRRKGLEDAVREGEERFRQLAEHVHEVFWLADAREPRMLYISPAYEDVWGRSCASLYSVPTSFLEGVHPDDRASVLDSFERQRRGERTERTYRVVRPDGTLRWVLDRGFPIVDGSGDVVRVAGVAEDITGRRQAEEAQEFLNHATAVLASSLDYEQTLNAVARLAVPRIADWCAVDVLNEAGDVERLVVTHTDPAKVELALELARRYPDPPESPRGLHHVLRTGQPEFYPEVPDEILVAGAKDEEHLRILRSLGIRSGLIVPLVARDRTLGAITLVTAETERKYTRADLELAMELARRAAIAVDNARLYRAAQDEIAERKREEAIRRRLEQELRERLDELAEQDRRKDQFLAMLGHELRNPLAPIRNAAQLLRMRAGADATLQRIESVIERQVAHMSRLVDDLLDVARITSGRIELRKSEVDLATLVTHSVESCRTLVDARGHQLSVLVPLDPVRLVGDPTRLEQVICNILVNAAKYTPDGGRIQVTAERERAGDEDRAVIRVRDNGRGIAPELLPHVFDLFTQEDRSLDRTEGGLGIGLTLVRSLVEQHGGTAEAHSAGPGLGSEFVVRLPALPRATAAAGPPAEAGRAAMPSRRILVVEDNADSADTLKELLELWGHEVRTTRTGEDALEIAQEFRPQVVLLDIGLPGIDGYQVARALREREDGRIAAIVALTGYAQDEDRRRCREAGIDHHLVKPVDLQELESLLAGLAGGETASSPPPATAARG